jgi:hypothetical protein
MKLGIVTVALLLATAPAWAESGFDPKYERDYNPFNQINRYDPDNPANPINRYNPDRPFSPLNRTPDR